MPRFFALGTNLLGGRAIIRGRDAKAYKVLRLRPGEEMTICDGNGTDYKCRLVRSDKDEAEAEIIEVVLRGRAYGVGARAVRSAKGAIRPTISSRNASSPAQGDMLSAPSASMHAPRALQKARALEQNKRGGGKAVGARHHSRGQMDERLC